jgi:hypothetical protein
MDMGGHDVGAATARERCGGGHDVGSATAEISSGHEPPTAAEALDPVHQFLFFVF